MKAVHKIIAAWLIAFLIVFPVGAALPLSMGVSTLLYPTGAPNVIATLPTSSALGTAVSWAPALVNLSAQVGYLVMQSAFGDMVRIPLTTAASPIPAPTPAQGTVPVFSGTTTYTGQGLDSSASTVTTPIFYGSSSQEVADQVCAYDGRGHMTSVGGAGGNNLTCSAAPKVSVTTSKIALGIQNNANKGVCTGGYYWDSATNTCKYKDAANVKDGKLDYSRSGTVLSITLGDDDTSTAGIIGTSGSGSATVEVSGVDQYKNPVQTKVTALSSGGSTVTQKVQTQDSSGNTGVVTKTFTVDSTGTVVSQSQTNTLDQLTLSTTAQTATVTSAVPSGSTVQATSGSGSGTSIDTSQLAKTGEAAAAAGTINAKLDERLGGATDSFSAGKNAEIDASLDAREAQIGTVASSTPTVDTSWLPSLMPGAAVACVPFPIETNFTTGLLAGISGSTTIDICDKLDLIRQIMGWFFGIVTVVYVFRVFTRSNQGAA